MALLGLLERFLGGAWVLLPHALWLAGEIRLLGGHVPGALVGVYLAACFGLDCVKVVVLLARHVHQRCIHAVVGLLQPRIEVKAIVARRQLLVVIELGLGAL